jgi:hypothetical protein
LTEYQSDPEAIKNLMKKQKAAENTAAKEEE